MEITHRIVDTNSFHYHVTVKTGVPPVKEITFITRGMTVGEYLRLSEFFEDREHNSLSQLLWINIAMNSIDGYEEFYFLDEEDMFEKDDDSEYITISEFDREILNHIPSDIMMHLGRYIHDKLTVIDELEESKFRGYTRFVSFLSDDENKKKNTESFDCEKCAEKGLIHFRNCGRKDKDELIQKYAKDKETPKKKVNPLEKYSSAKRVKRFESKEQVDNALNKKANVEDGQILLSGFKFPECPITWIENSIKTKVSVFFYCINTNQNFFSGGVDKQPWKWFKYIEIVKSELNAIEAEDIKKRQKG